MKKLLFTAFVVVGALAYGQKGSWYVGGTTSFNSGNTKRDSVIQKRMSWAFSPEIGTFLTNQIQLGIGVTLNGSKTTLPLASESSNFQAGGTLYCRYFFGENAFKPFVGLNFTGLIGNNVVTNLNPALPDSKVTNKLLTINPNLNVGFAYAVSPRVAVVGSLGVLGFKSERTTPEVGTATVVNDFGFDINSLGNRFTIGVYYTFKAAK